MAARILLRFGPNIRRQVGLEVFRRDIVLVLEVLKIDGAPRGVFDEVDPPVEIPTVGRRSDCLAFRILILRRPAGQWIAGEGDMREVELLEGDSLPGKRNGVSSGIADPAQIAIGVKSVCQRAGLENPLRVDAVQLEWKIGRASCRERG